MDLKELARLGAAARVAEIQSELADIRKAFPGLVRRRRVQSGSGGGTFVPGEGKRDAASSPADVRRSAQSRIDQNAEVFGGSTKGDVVVMLDRFDRGL